MAVQILGKLMGRFRTTPQLAKITHGDLSTMRKRLRAERRLLAEAQDHLEEIASLSRNLPPGPHHDVMTKASTMVDKMKMVVNIQEKQIEHFTKFLGHTAESLKEARRQADK